MQRQACTWLRSTWNSKLDLGAYRGVLLFLMVLYWLFMLVRMGRVRYLSLSLHTKTLKRVICQKTAMSRWGLSLSIHLLIHQLMNQVTGKVTPEANAVGPT